MGFRGPNIGQLLPRRSPGWCLLSFGLAGVGVGVFEAQVTAGYRLRLFRIRFGFQDVFGGELLAFALSAS